MSPANGIFLLRAQHFILTSTPTSLLLLTAIGPLDWLAFVLEKRTILPGGGFNFAVGRQGS